MKTKIIFALAAILLLTGCFPYVYHNQEEVLLKGINIEDTLQIAEIELAEGGFDSVLTVWALRDQSISQENAAEISRLYFEYIDQVAAYENKTIASFAVWHLAWAVSNFYRIGDQPIKEVLETAYQDARVRPEKLEKFDQIAEEHINGDKIYMGDVHDLGRFYARTHLIVPGNKHHIQSLSEYRINKEEERKKTQRRNKRQNKKENEQFIKLIEQIELKEMTGK